MGVTFRSVVAACAVGLGASMVSLAGEPASVVQAVDAGKATAAEWSARAWRIAKSGRFDDFLSFASTSPGASGVTESALAQHAESLRRFQANLAARETRRAERHAEVSRELDERLAAGGSNPMIAKALRSALELWLISRDKPAVLAEPRVASLLETAEQAARDAERNGDWLAASELFGLLDGILEESGRFKADKERQLHRLAMLRLYVPERLWELRNERVKAQGEKPLAPYNPTGDDFRAKLASIDQEMVVRAIARATDHVERVPTRRVLESAIAALETMISTVDLQRAFPGLSDEAARGTMLESLRSERDRLGETRKGVFGRVSEPGIGDTDALITRVLAFNDRSVKLPREAVLHEFGNGAMDALDEFSAIIWPDELSRFNRNTQGRFIGIGVQIEPDDQSNVRIVTPIEGTPAHRAGIRAGDVIKRIDGKNAYGMSMDQVIDNITGVEGTQVVLTVERAVEDEAAPGAEAPTNQKNAPGVRGEADAKVAAPKTEELEFTITRQMINVVSVKGWRREGQREDAWDWFIDRPGGIAYVRLTQFSESTATELRRAVAQMQRSGLRGLILDLRFNPGGYLDQAVQVANLWVDSGVIVSMQGPNGRSESPEVARSNVARLSEVPTVVLVNEGSASASEIVSGTLQHYGQTGDINVLVLGQRSFGKGSVQKVFGLAENAAMKLTMQYYAIPDTAPPGHRIIHRKPGAHEWGISPNLAVEMLPKQTTDAILLRRNADVIPLTEAEARKLTPPNPDKLLTDGLDLQLESALVILQSATLAERGQGSGQAMKDR